VDGTPGDFRVEGVFGIGAGVVPRDVEMITQGVGVFLRPGPLAKDRAEVARVTASVKSRGAVIGRTSSIRRIAAGFSPFQARQRT